MQVGIVIPLVFLPLRLGNTVLIGPVIILFLPGLVDGQLFRTLFQLIY